MNKKDIQLKLEWLTCKWWFFAIIIAVQFLPPIATKGFSQGGVSKFLAVHVMNNFMRSPQAAMFYPLFKIIPIILVISIIFLGNKVSRIFSIYAGIAYLFFNVLQNFSVTTQYGLGILTQNLVMMFLISLLWFWEAYAGKNDFSPVNTSVMKISIALLAFLAFWDPINPVTHGINFDPVFLVNNAGGLAFCMMTPVFLAILIWFYPKVNLALLRVNSLAGIIIGIFNVLVVFANPAVYWWFGFLHIPLFVLGVCGMWLGYRRNL